MLYEKILIDQGVEKFWLIKHKIDRYVCSFVNGVRRIEETEDRINELFFIKNNNLYKIAFGIIDDDSLFKELIDKSVKNSIFTVKNPLIKLPSIKAPDICKEKIFYFNECKRIIDSELKKS